jgi:hypothetical protein
VWEVGSRSYGARSLVQDHTRVVGFILKVVKPAEFEQKSGTSRKYQITIRPVNQL